MDNVITCGSMMDFMEVLQGCVERGLTFTACTTTLQITLTGGY